MSDFKPNFLFKLIDPIFLKAGKPIARHIAKKDTTEDILFKRENQSKLIVSTSIKGMRNSFYFMRIYLLVLFVMFLFLFPYIVFKANGFSDKTLKIYTPYIISAIMMLVLSSFVVVFSTTKQFERVGTNHYCYTKEKLYILKSEAYRIHEFYRRPIHIDMFDFFIPLVHIAAIYLIISLFRSKYEPLFMCKIAIMFYVISSAVVFVSWCFNYLMAGTIYHSDDFGKKEKKTSKEEKNSMVPDAI